MKCFERPDLLLSGKAGKWAEPVFGHEPARQLIAEHCDGLQHKWGEIEQIQYLRHASPRDAEFASEIGTGCERPVGKQGLPLASQRYGVAARLSHGCRPAPERRREGDLSLFKAMKKSAYGRFPGVIRTPQTLLN